MEQTIYADVLFAVNFSMDFLALYVTAFILKLRFNVKKGVLAAIIGGLYGVFSIAVELEAMIGVLCAVTIGVIMCILLIGFKGGKILFRTLTVFLSVNLIIGGGMTVVYEFFNGHGGADSILIYGEPETVEQQLPMALFIAAGIVITVILMCFGRGLIRQGGARRVTLKIRHRGRVATVTALQDSGNLLVEPISGLPVVILRDAVAQKLLPPPVYQTVTELTATENGCAGEKIRFILYETVSGKGMLGAFKPDSMTLNGTDISGWVAVSDKDHWSIDGISDAIVPTVLVN